MWNEGEDVYYAIDFDTINSKLIGYTEITDYWQLDRRTINEYELIFMQKGSIEIIISNNKYVLEAGDYLFIEPGVMHEGKAITSGAFFYVHIVCDVNAVNKNYISEKINYHNQKLNEHIAENNFYTLPDRFKIINIKNNMKVKKSKEVINTSFQEALSYRNELTINSILFINIRIKEIFVLLQRELMIELKMNDIYSSNGQINPYIKEAVIYLNNNVKKKIALSDVSDSVGISCQYLNRLFKQILGCTIIEYINRRKIKIAKELIVASTLTFREVSFEIGLDNPYYFSRLFKKEEGLTPSEYRKRYSSKYNW